VWWQDETPDSAAKPFRKEIQNAIINTMDYDRNNLCLVISKFSK